MQPRQTIRLGGKKRKKTGKAKSNGTSTARIDPSTGDTAPDVSPTDSGGRSPFDVARISPDGVSVFAGKSLPNAQVTLRADGKRVGSVRADENGEWVIATEHKFASLDPQLEVITSTAGKQVGQTTGDVAELDAVEGSATSDSPQRGAKVQVDDAPAGGRAKAVTDKLMTALQGLVDEARAKIDSEGDRNPVEPHRADDTPTPGLSAPGSEVVAETDAARKTGENRDLATEKRTNDPPPARDNETRAAFSDDRNFAASSADDQNTRVTTASTTRRDRETVVPVPLKFVYRKAVMTDDGRKAASLLLEYVRLKKFQAITLTGHADERGSRTLNMDLSLSRLHRVAEYLRDGGFEGELELIAKGEAEPFSQVDRSKFLKEELWELDRRVELRETR